MIMKRWRVGSLSMGIILTAFGILMLVSLIVKINVINVVYMLSPIVLICLGIEILLHLFVVQDKDNGDTKIKYDILSIIFVSCVLFIGTGVYVLMGVTGFFGSYFDSKEEMLEALGMNIRNETVYKEYAAEFDGNEISEIALFGEFHSIQVFSTESDKIKVEYQIKIGTSDKEYAESIIDKYVKLETDSKRVRMILSPVMLYYDRKLEYPSINCTVYLPKDKTIDLTQCPSYDYNLSIDSQINEENIIK